MKNMVTFGNNFIGIQYIIVTDGTFHIKIFIN